MTTIRFPGDSEAATMLEIDGSQGEGGGQILRSSLALSLITGTPFRLRQIRARRSRPGLQPQHLTCVRAAAKVGQAQVRGDAVGSTDLTFVPGEVRPGEYHFPIGTAGATSLVLHTVYLPLALQKASSTVTIEGGTHVPQAPCFDFLDGTWRNFLATIGVRIELRMDRAGFYPRGGGRIQARIAGNSVIQGLQLLERSEITRVRGVSIVSGDLPDSIARRQAERARERLDKLGLEADFDHVHWRGAPGSVLTLTMEETPIPIVCFGLGARGKRAEAVADEAVDALRAFWDSGAPVDEHSADQLLLPLVFAEGSSRMRVSQITSHFLSNRAVIGQFVSRSITCEGAEGEPGEVRLAGPSESESPQAD